jgi:hypothetical protein
VEPRENVLRNPIPAPICKGSSCACPQGEVRGKNGGCVASTTIPSSDQCQLGEYWNGGGCIASANQCPPNSHWNGTSCVESAVACAGISGRASLMVAEARSIKSQMEAECSQNPSGQSCMDLTQSHEGALQRYRMLLNEESVNCRTGLPDPLSL